jgi:Cytoskeletal-regulatory complex EF hand
MFPRSRLPQHKLAAIWALCDEQKHGNLRFDEFVKAMELISIAQAGQDVTEKQWLLRQKVRPSMRKRVAWAREAAVQRCDADGNRVASAATKRSHASCRCALVLCQPTEHRAVACALPTRLCSQRLQGQELLCAAPAQHALVSAAGGHRAAADGRP